MKKIAVIPGDGIGIEVIEGAIKILKKSEEILSGKTLFDFSSAKFFDINKGLAPVEIREFFTSSSFTFDGALIIKSCAF